MWLGAQLKTVPPHTVVALGACTLFLSLPIFNGETLLQLTALLRSHMCRRRAPGAGLLVAMMPRKVEGARLLGVITN